MAQCCISSTPRHLHVDAGTLEIMEHLRGAMLV